MARETRKRLDKKPADPSELGPPSAEWVAVLRGGAAGVTRWNQLPAAERQRVRLCGADLSGCALGGVRFHRVAVDGVSFARADLRCADFGNMSATRADFTGANLAVADLRFVSARRANFSGADLRRADLHQAQFVSAKLAGADLRRADLSEADLRDADLSEAMLTGASLTGTIFNKGTQWPTGYVIPSEAEWRGRDPDPRRGGRPKSAGVVDFDGLMTVLRLTTDPMRLGRVLARPTGGPNQLFAEVGPAHVCGVVRGDKPDDPMHACVLTDSGDYACCTPDMRPCKWQGGRPCGHLLALIIGLAREGRLAPSAADPWLLATAGRPPRCNQAVHSRVCDAFLKYQGAADSGPDWRPVETIPEDFYTV